MENLRIKSAAIKDKKGDIYSLPIPATHSDILSVIIKRDRELPNGIKCGYLLSDGSFAGRKRAMKVAKKSGQLLVPNTDAVDLYSSDVW